MSRPLSADTSSPVFNLVFSQNEPTVARAITASARVISSLFALFLARFLSNRRVDPLRYAQTSGQFCEAASVKRLVRFNA